MTMTTTMKINRTSRKMKVKSSTALTILLTLTLFAIAQAHSVTEKANVTNIQTENEKHKLRCDFDEAVFDSNFPSGRISACSKLEEGHYLLETHPENTPINPSPWYAFSVKFTDEYLRANSTQQTTISVSISAENTRARYIPKISKTLNTRNYQNW